MVTLIFLLTLKVKLIVSPNKYIFKRIVVSKSHFFIIFC